MQVLANLIGVVYMRVRTAFEARDGPLLRTLAALMAGAIDALDTVLGTQSAFLFGRWIADARRMAHTAAEADIFEFNARNLVTVWGPHGEWEDYSSKHWAGLVKEYYGHRWRLFLDALLHAADYNNWRFDEFRDFHEPCRKFELQWQHARTSFDTSAKGDAIAIASEISVRFDVDLQALCG